MKHDHMNFFGVIDLACQRPGMFMIEHSLEPLETMAIGYEFAIAFHGIEDETARFNASFRRFLEDRYGWSMARGWSGAIAEHLRENETAIDRLSDLIAEYQAYLRNQPGADPSPAKRHLSTVT